MNRRFLIDTDVIVDYLRDEPKAIAYFENLNEELLVSAITVAELYAGMRDHEKEQLTEFLSAFQTIPLNHKIAKQGGLYRRDYGATQGVGLADALIAATAVSQSATLITLNKKHFPMLKDVKRPYRKD